MIAFLMGTAVCREHFLLEYFGEAAEGDCGHCDVCRRKAGLNIRPAADISKAILDVMAQGPQKLQVIIEAMACFDKDQIIKEIRVMVDEGRIGMEGSVLRLKA